MYGRGSGIPETTDHYCQEIFSVHARRTIFEHNPVIK